MSLEKPFRIAVCPNCDDVHLALGAVTLRISKADAAALAESLREIAGESGRNRRPAASSRATGWFH